MSISNIAKRKLIEIARKYIMGYKADSESYITYLKRIGVKVGEGTCIFSPGRTEIDIQNPHYLTIGKNVLMTGPVTILTHDYSWSVCKTIEGNIVGNQKPVTIGDNVFIGWGATILGGTCIGSNVIIGAGSVVSKNCESNSVYGGNPAKRIMSLEEYYEKRKSTQVEEAKEFAVKYYERFDKIPDKELFHEYFYVFTPSINNDDYVKIFEHKLKLMNNYDISLEYIKQHDPPFNGYDEFLKFCGLV